MSHPSQATKKDRLTRRFEALRATGRGGLVTFVTAGDPDLDSSTKLLCQLPTVGADVIELGMPFSDPMADGPAIQASSQRALAAGMTLAKTLAMVRIFREEDIETPVILMGYFNPIYQYGSQMFVEDAVTAGVDGLIIVDLPPEEDDELCHPAMTAGLHWIRLVTPTTDNRRMVTVLKNTSGFVYYVSIAGITGTHSASMDVIRSAVRRLSEHTDLPVAVGFGIQTPKQVGEVADDADAAVVGSALVREVERNLDNQGNAKPGLVNQVLERVQELSAALRN